MRLSIAVFVFTLTLLFALPAQAEIVNWQLDKTHTSVSFSVRHLGISKVKGVFKDFSAMIKADSKTGKVVFATAEVKVDSIDTGEPKRDEHLMQDDFFHETKYPKMKLRTTSIVKKGEEITIHAMLTIRGVTKNVIFKGEHLGTAKVDFGPHGPTMRAGYTLKGKIKRSDFGLSFNQLVEGVALVGDEVTIMLDIEIFRKL